MKRRNSEIKEELHSKSGCPRKKCKGEW